MKMYILIKDSVPLGYAIVAAAHASLAAYLKFRDSDEVKQWLEPAGTATACKAVLKWVRFPPAPLTVQLRGSDYILLR